MNYLLDTNIALHYLRESNLSLLINKKYNPFGGGNIPLFSIVSWAELKSIAFQNRWGVQKIQSLNYFQKEVFIVDIHVEEIVEKYVEIDAFSQGKHPTISATHSARNMGKNDLWIAATATVLGANLLTTDNDFLHLHGTFLQVETIKLPFVR